MAERNVVTTPRRATLRGRTRAGRSSPVTPMDLDPRACAPANDLRRGRWAHPWAAALLVLVLLGVAVRARHGALRRPSTSTPRGSTTRCSSRRTTATPSAATCAAWRPGRRGPIARARRSWSLPWCPPSRPSGGAPWGGSRLCGHACSWPRSGASAPCGSGSSRATSGAARWRRSSPPDGCCFTPTPWRRGAAFSPMCRW
jgi:hypothetical protein